MTTGWRTPTVLKRYGRTCSKLARELTRAHESYQRAARMTASLPEQRYLELRAARLN
jgi:hypothetical protein